MNHNIIFVKRNIKCANDLVTEQEIIENHRRRSSQRLRFEAQVSVFKNQNGDLEAIRKVLGLRPSQICEILRVHPSAWTRWTRSKSAPPHVYQMIEWYMELLKWRGQHHPTTQNFEHLDVIAKEDPQSYVPAPNEKLDFRRFFEKPSVIKALFAVWILQAFVWVVLTLYLVKKT